jgi:hypothetical protein
VRRRRPGSRRNGRGSCGLRRNRRMRWRWDGPRHGRCRRSPRARWRSCHRPGHGWRGRSRPLWNGRRCGPRGCRGLRDRCGRRRRLRRCSRQGRAAETAELASCGERFVALRACHLLENGRGRRPWCRCCGGRRGVQRFSAAGTRRQGCWVHIPAGDAPHVTDGSLFVCLSGHGGCSFRFSSASLGAVPTSVGQFA